MIKDISKSMITSVPTVGSKVFSNSYDWQNYEVNKISKFKLS